MRAEVQHGALQLSRMKVIVTSFLFPEGKLDRSRLKSIFGAVGDDPQRLVIDLSCRRKGPTWFVATNKWQTITGFEISGSMASSSRALCGVQAKSRR